MPMRRVIFIRSYAKDLDWISYCLRSIRKYVTGIDGVTLAVPQADVAAFRAAGHECVGCPDYQPGYYAQQSTKMHADLFVRGGDAWIIYLDDDCLVTEPFDAAELFAPNGKPYALWTPYAELGNKVPWQPSTEAALGFPCPNEVMRRHGAVYSSADLRGFRAWFLANRKTPLDAYIRQQGEAKKNFAEFNVIGSYFWHLKHGEREWVRAGSDSTTHGQPGGNLPRLPLRQFNSGAYNRPSANLTEIEKILA